MLIYDHYPDYPILNPPLLEHILNQQKDNPTMTLGVAGGLAWSGYKTQWNWPTQLQLLYNHILSKYRHHMKLGVVNITSWGNILQVGASLNQHNHVGDGTKWTGVYYLTDADLTIMDKQFRFREGDYILFPPEEIHSVLPVKDKVRVSLAFNIKEVTT